MDNSPAWDGALAAVPAVPAGLGARVGVAGLPPGLRRDLRHGREAERPTDTDYARYVHLAAVYRDGGYRDDDHLARASFCLIDPLFNAVLAWSEEALADIATELGGDSAGHRARAVEITAALVRRHLDLPSGRFLAADPRTGAVAREHTVSGLAPLVMPGLPARVADGLVRQATSPVFRSGPRAPLASADLTGPTYDPARYWRGPAWINTGWLVWRGLLRHARWAEANALRDGMLGAVRSAGFREYVDAQTGQGRGAMDFGWTAALVLDLLVHRPAIDLTAARLPEPRTLTSGHDRLDQPGVALDSGRR